MSLTDSPPATVAGRKESAREAIARGPCSWFEEEQLSSCLWSQEAHEADALRDLLRMKDDTISDLKVVRWLPWKY